MSGRLEGRVAAITGASSGIGRAAAELFVQEGAKVALGDIQDDAGQALADSLGNGAVYVHCNVTSEDDVAALVDTATGQFGQLDVMYNNAGIVGAVGPVDTTPADEWHATMDVLLHGVFYGVKHAARAMKPRMSGSIISMSSTAGVMGGLGPHAYAAAKHAVVGLTKNAAAELCRFGIRVNCIAPASMLTPMVAFAHSGDHTNMEGTRAELAESSPLIGRPGLATDVANAALWLASDESGYTSGHTLGVDAGFTTGARADAPGFADYAPMIREAGRTGL
ncbi:MAG: SDR family oxidoreductase [bacterium]|nr:SDR family oxidoreductase [bacterium]